MKVVIEFYRVREQDDAHAVLGRVTREAVDSEAAIRMATSLFHTLDDMPQKPDFVRVCDEGGSELFCGAAGTETYD